MPSYQPFIGFTYNGKHSIEDLHIYRTSNGNRYDENLTPTMTDKVVDVPGGDGQHYFGTTFKNRTFTVNYAFDNLKKTDITEMKRVFSGDGIHDLVFDEDRGTDGKALKIWSAKVTGTATMKHLCFEENGQDIYKGEGSITFTCYYPYAHSENIKFVTNVLPEAMDNIPTNDGDLPAPIVFDFIYQREPENADRLFGLIFVQGRNNLPTKEIQFSTPIEPEPNQKLHWVWDSGAGIVYDYDTKKIIPTSNALLKLPVGSDIGTAYPSPLFFRILPGDSSPSHGVPVVLNTNEDTLTRFVKLYR